MTYGPRFLFQHCDSDMLPITPTLYLDLLEIYDRGGILFWCREGEWRAIGGPVLQQQMQYLRDYMKLGKALARPPDLREGSACYLHWADTLMVPSELVRWLRQEGEQLGEADASADAPAE